MSLSAFLAANAEKRPNSSYIASDRFLDPETGEPEVWELRCLSGQEDDQLRMACTRQTAIPGRSGQYRAETDWHQYVAKLTAASVVYPNLNSRELQDSYHVMSAEALVKTMLTAGEYQRLASKVQEVSGFSMAAAVEEAKN